MASRILFLVATIAVTVINGNKVPTCLKLKNNAPGISYQGEKLYCYAPADGTYICDNLGLHSYQVKELDKCTRCCLVTPTNRPLTTRPTASKTWIYVVVGVLGGVAAVTAVTAAALVTYRKVKGSRAAEVAGTGAGGDVEGAGGDGERAGGDVEQAKNEEEVPLGGIQPSDMDERNVQIRYV